METAVQKIEDLISQSTALEPAPKLYPLEQTELTVAIQIPGRDLTLYHKLRKPMLAELVERDQQTPFETEEVGGGEDRLSVDDEGPNVRLWNKTALEVKGYKVGMVTPGEWVKVSPELVAQIPAGHKSAAIRGQYQSSFELEWEEDEGFALGATSHAVKQVFGEYVITHSFRAPTEAERRDFRRQANETRFARGSRKVRTKILTYLKTYVELYDRLFQGIEGVSTDDAATVAAQRAMVDPIWKRGAIDALMRGFEASLSD